MRPHTRLLVLALGGCLLLLPCVPKPAAAHIGNHIGAAPYYLAFYLALGALEGGAALLDEMESSWASGDAGRMFSVYATIQNLGDSAEELELKARARSLMTIFLQTKGENDLATRVASSMDELGGGAAVAALRDEAKSIVRGAAEETPAKPLSQGSALSLGEDLERWFARHAADKQEPIQDIAPEQAADSSLWGSVKGSAEGLWSKGRNASGELLEGDGDASPGGLADLLQKGASLFPSALPDLGEEGQSRLLSLLETLSGSREGAAMESLAAAGADRLQALQESLTLELQTMETLYAAVKELEKWGIGASYQAMLAKGLVALQAGVMGNMEAATAIYDDMQTMGDSEGVRKERLAALGWIGVGYINKADFEKAEAIYAQMPSMGPEALTGPETVKLAKALIAGYMRGGRSALLAGHVSDNRVEKAVAVFRNFPAYETPEKASEWRADVAETLVFRLLDNGEIDRAQSVYDEFRQGGMHARNARVGLPILRRYIYERLVGEAGGLYTRVDKADALYATFLHDSGDPYVCEAAEMLVEALLRQQDLPQAEAVYRTIASETCAHGLVCRDRINNMEALLIEAFLAADQLPRAESLYAGQAERPVECNAKSCMSLYNLVKAFLREGSLEKAFVLVVNDPRPVDKGNGLCLRAYQELIAAYAAAKNADKALEVYRAMPDPEKSFEVGTKTAALLLIIAVLEADGDADKVKDLRSEESRLKELKYSLSLAEDRERRRHVSSGRSSWGDDD